MALTNTQSIIDKLELYAGDSTDLSSTDELDLIQKKYNQVLEEHDWEFLKKTATGTLSTSLQYVTAPADFRSFAKNYQSYKKVIYIGSNYDAYEIVPFDNRREFRDQKGYAYYDALNARIYFTRQPDTADTYEFDYLHIPTALTTSTSPIFPVRYWDALYHSALMDNDIIQLSDKARREYKENEAAYRTIIDKMVSWNATLSNNDTYGLQ